MMYDFPTNILMQKKNRKKLRKGFTMETRGRVLHPFHSEDLQVHQVTSIKRIEYLLMSNYPFLSKLRVLSDFKTSSKPVLVAMIPEREVESKIAPMKIVVKQGDDFRQDVATMTVFRLFNHLWRYVYPYNNQLELFHRILMIAGKVDSNIKILMFDVMHTVRVQQELK